MGQPARERRFLERPYLEGWKEIAGYFGRTARTVQRWEHGEGLPVRRHAHLDLASVYADPDELDAWRKQHAPAPEAGALSFGVAPGDERVLTAMADDHWKRRSREGFEQCMALAHAALAVNPGYAPAYAQLALAHQARATYGYRPPVDDLRLAREYADRALSQAPDSVKALQARAFIHYFFREWSPAEAVFDRLRALDPRNATTEQYFSLLRLAQGQHDDACRVALDAERLDPSWPLLAAHVSWVLHSAGRFAEAIAKARAVIERDRGFWRGYFNLTLSLLAMGRSTEAVRAIQVSKALDQNPCMEAILVHALSRDGRRQDAVEHLNRIRSRRRYLSPCWHAYACAGLDDHAGALQLLRRSLREHEWFVIFVESEPGFAGVRADSKYEAIRRSIGLP
jgi:tetratricopeptide (TPR) repeat protein